MHATELPAPWLRGVLDLLLLSLLSEGEAYGYELSGRLADAGIGAVPGGSLYPSLLRLEKAGHLVSDWRAGDGGPGRKYYRLTASGHATLARDGTAWLAFASRVGGLLDRAGVR